MGKNLIDFYREFSIYQKNNSFSFLNEDGDANSESMAFDYDPDVQLCLNTIGFILHLIRANKLSEYSSALNDDDDIKLLVQQFSMHNCLLLHAAVRENQETLKVFLNLLNGSRYKSQNYRFKDDDGNGPLHVASPECVGVIITYRNLHLIKSINDVNYNNQTALHIAAMQGDMRKARYLIKFNADTEIKDSDQHTFWSIPSVNSQSNSLDVYRAFGITGHVLRLSFFVWPQYGLNCGYYAVANATHYLFSAEARFFSRPPLPARKRDSKKPIEQSLRQLRKKLGIPFDGPIYSVEHLAKLIAANECQHKLFTVNNYKQFMEIIQAAVQKKLPLILGFNNEEFDENKNNISNNKLHWATIVGWKKENQKETILLAEHGGFKSVNAKALFNAFYNLERKVPDFYLFKVKGRDWNRGYESVQASVDMKVCEVKNVVLDEFRRILLVVFPPEHDLQLFDAVKEAPMSYRRHS